MSLSRHNSTNCLSDDVLLVIFDHLDDQDLLRCEIVCRQWRNVLLSGRPWRRLFHRQIVSSPRWRQVWWNFGMDEKKPETMNYRELCKVIIQEFNELGRNWRTGNFKNIKKKCELILNDFQHFVIGKDWIACIDNAVWSSGVAMILFYSRASMVVQRHMVIPKETFAVMNTEIVVFWDKKNVKILDINGRLISEVPELDEDERISWNLASCCIRGDRMVVLSKTKKREKLSLWDVSDPSKVTRLNSKHFNLDLPTTFTYDEDLEIKSFMKMDEKFIAISTFRNKCTRFYFFSMKTLDLNWQKTVAGDMRDNFVYEHGMFLLYVKKKRSSKFGLIEMYDATSDLCFREMRTTVNEREALKNRVGFNSKFMAIAESNVSRRGYKINIYDVEAVKNKKSAKDLLVHTFDVNGVSDIRLMMNESEIICIEKFEINFFYFGSLDCFRNPANSVTLSLPWRSVWRSKGVDEEPLQPVRHMKVYKEVLQHFHQLSMNCQRASKTFPVDKVDLATFTFGDDFISYRRYNLDVVTFDENMNASCRKMNYKTVQISKTSLLSVMGKTIQLIDSATGQVYNEIQRERDVIGWHLNCNLLVCVSQIADREHLLSVWRVVNSVNLNHIKDVTIEDYDGSLQVDDNFIAIETAVQERAGTKTYSFISMKTFQVERSVSSRSKYFDYDKGYLFLTVNPYIWSKYFVRILDVASGTFLRDIRMEPDQLYVIKCCANSNYVVMLSRNGYYSKLHVYDLKCLKETDAVPSHLLLTSFDLEGKVKKVAMNETQIVCLNSNTMQVVDLKLIDRLRCPEYIE